MLRSDRREAHGVAMTRRDGTRPGLELGARPLEAVVGVAQLPGGQRLPDGRCTRRWASSARRCRAGRTRTARARSAASRGGSRCSITSTTAAASKPCRRSSRYSSEPCSSVSRARLALGQAVQPQSLGRRLQHAVRDVHADDLLEAVGPPAARAAAAPRRSPGRARAARRWPAAPPARRRCAAPASVGAAPVGAGGSTASSASAASTGCSSSTSRANASRTRSPRRLR